MKKQLVRTVIVEEVYQDKSFRDGNKIDWDVSTLPRGTYYLHSIHKEGSKETFEKSKVLLK